MDQATAPADQPASNDIYANPPDPDVLELEPIHPGIGDAAYVARRHELFALCRQYRLGSLGPPIVDYNAEEERIWREVSPKLDELHVRHASRIYLDAKRELGISEVAIPQLRHLSGHLTGRTGMHLVPAEGPIAYRIFYAYIADGGFPCTQFIRHGSKPEYTPEPDMIHDCLGHVPPLLNDDYAALLRMIGRAAVRARSGDHVLALKRLSWFSIEFGLIEEADEARVFGAGILSSMSEIPYSLSPGVERRPFVTDEVIETDYDWTKMQELLFVIPSFGFLRQEVERLVQRMGIDVS
ncbi:MAG: phenylalanine 4-monooxygenase [Acidobacteria bacterium]|nr:phenylalanine 4-monooxygenase [Acidobacteriota bacterium]